MYQETSKTILIVGDEACGKTCLLKRFTHNQFEKEHHPTDLDNHMVYVNINGQQIVLDSLDTNENSYDKFPPKCYLDIDVILMCFSVTQPNTFASIASKWSPEMKRLCPSVPIVLIGNKSELWDNSSTKLENALNVVEEVRQECGQEMAKKIDAYAYCKCSAKSDEGVKEVFETAFQATERKIEKKKECIVL